MNEKSGFFNWSAISAIATCIAAGAAIWGVSMANQIVRDVIVLKKVSPPFAVISAEGTAIPQTIH